MLILLIACAVLALGAAVARTATGALRRGDWTSELAAIGAATNAAPRSVGARAARFLFGLLATIRCGQMDNMDC
jgi:hypothetical protein